MINDHDKIKIQLLKKINELSEELKNKNQENLKIEEDLNQINNKYEKLIPIKIIKYYKKNNLKNKILKNKLKMKK